MKLMILVFVVLLCGCINTCEGNNCACYGSNSEGCHHMGWNMSTPECNLSIENSEISQVKE